MLQFQIIPATTTHGSQLEALLAAFKRKESKNYLFPLVVKRTLKTEFF